MSTWRPLGPSRGERDPRTVSESLDRVTRRWGGPPAQVLTAVFAHWMELVGDDIAAHATPRSLRNGVLTVTVDHPAWATQLRYLSSQVVQELQRRTAAGEAISELRIQVGAPEDEAPAGPAGRARWRPPPKGRRSR